MDRVKIACVALSLVFGLACAPPQPGAGPVSADVESQYARLFRGLDSVDVNSRASVENFFGVTLTLSSQGQYFKYWEAEVPASSSSAHLLLDYRERIPGSGAERSFFAIRIPEPAYTYASVERRYPNIALVRAPGHARNSGWGFEVPAAGGNEIAMGFDAGICLLRVVSIMTPTRDLP